MMFDTDVLIWYFRGNPKAKAVLNNAGKISISAVTLMELIQGMKNKQELSVFNKFLSVNSIRIHYINEEISLHAVHLLEDYVLSNGVELADALIAATALHYGEDILTANIKHYQCLPNLILQPFNPHGA